MDKSVVVGRKYRDAKGRIWEITSTDGPHLYPVTAYRWDGMQSSCRCFQLDGRFEKDKGSSMDLVEALP